MARTVRHISLETRTARQRLAYRRKPYWWGIEVGLHLGYRRLKGSSGTWVARRFIGDGRYVEIKIGVADDLQSADGVAIRTFPQAQDAARAWWRGEQRRALGHGVDEGPYTVAKALDAYFVDRERRGSKGVAKDRSASAVRIVPVLGGTDLSKLTTKHLRDWHADLAVSPKLSRSSDRVPKHGAKVAIARDPDHIRARRATANRTLTVLKAALTHAFHDGHVASDETWRKVKPFREVDAPIIQFLQEADCQRLLNACDGAFKNLVSAALLTGCRYGELTRMRAADYNARAGTITVQLSKAGKPRHVVLNDEGVALFTALTAGRAGQDSIFVRDDGHVWGASHQQRPLEVASKRARIEPLVTFHILRHTYASGLAMRGVPLRVIADQLGHSDTRMTERHYAHLSPTYVAETIRANLPKLGISPVSNITALSNRQA